MDFSNLNTKNAAEAGAFCHINHPVWGHPLYTGPGAPEKDPKSPKFGKWTHKSKEAVPCGVKIRGVESPTVREGLNKLHRNRLQSQNKKGQSLEEQQETGFDFVCSLVIEFVGFARDGKPIEATEENKRAFFEQSDDLVDQVFAFARERQNFFEQTSQG